MKKVLLVFLALVMILSMAACGEKPEVIENFDDLDTTKFHGALSGDGNFLVMYEGSIDEAVMGAVLATPDGTSITLSEDTIVKNPDGNSLLWFEQVVVSTGDTVALTLEKEGYEKLEFDVIVEP
ncbi:MAG: hypothetical protein E7225_03170 [Clostridiales bacterium]|nr:hypothetical protein [Clostridiales bacterium]